MDYGSLSNLTHWLAELFWGDLERHHPGIDSLNLPPEVAEAWKERIATLPGGKPRRERYGLLTAVRAFCDDINQWAYDPARCGPRHASRAGVHRGRHPLPAHLQVLDGDPSVTPTARRF